AWGGRRALRRAPAAGLLRGRLTAHVHIARRAARVWGSAGPDDRRGGVLVDAVGLVDLDVRESRGRERVGELLACEGAGDAAGPRGHVSARGLVHVRIGAHVPDPD